MLQLCRDAEEAMLAAAIRASLIEAGEPDTRHQIPQSSSQQLNSSMAANNGDHLHKQQQQQQRQQQAVNGPASTLSPFQMPATAQQHQQQPQQPQQQQQRQQDQQTEQQPAQKLGQRHQARFQEGHLPNGKALAPEQYAAAMQFGHMAAALQGVESANALGQGRSQGEMGQVPNTQSDVHLRTARSSDGALGRGSQDGSSQLASSSGAGAAVMLSNVLPALQYSHACRLRAARLSLHAYVGFFAACGSHRPIQAVACAHHSRAMHAYLLTTSCPHRL